MAEEDRIYTYLNLIMPHYSTATRQGSQYAGFPWTNDQQALIFIPYTSYDGSDLPKIDLDGYDVADPEFELAKSNIYSLVRNHYYGSEPITSERGDLDPDDPVFDEYRYLTVQVYYAGSWQKLGETHRVEFEKESYDTISIRGDKLFADPDVLFGSDEMLPIYLAPRKPHIRICLGEKPDGSDADVYGYYVASDIYTYFNLYDAVALMRADAYGENYDAANSLPIFIEAHDKAHSFLDEDIGRSNVFAHTRGLDTVKTEIRYGKYVDVPDVTPDIIAGGLISEANPNDAYVYSQTVNGISYSKLLNTDSLDVDTTQADVVNYYIVDADGQPVFKHTEVNKTTFEAATLLSNNTKFDLVHGVKRINTNGTMQLKDLVIEHVFTNRADRDRVETVAVKFHNAVALTIAREGEEVPEVPEEPSIGQRIVTTTDLDQTIIVTPQKKVAVNVDNKTIGLINGKLGVLGGAGASVPSGFKVVNTIGPNMPVGDYYFIPTSDAIGMVDFTPLDFTDVPDFGRLPIRSDNRYGVDNTDKPDPAVALVWDSLKPTTSAVRNFSLVYGVKSNDLITLTYVTDNARTNARTGYDNVQQHLVCAMSLSDNSWIVVSNTSTAPRYFKGSLDNIAKNFGGDMNFMCFIANQPYGITGFPSDFSQTSPASESLYTGSEIILAFVQQHTTDFNCFQTITFDFNGQVLSYKRIGTRNRETGDFTFSKWTIH